MGFICIGVPFRVDASTVCMHISSGNRTCMWSSNSWLHAEPWSVTVARGLSRKQFARRIMVSSLTRTSDSWAKAPGRFNNSDSNTSSIWGHRPPIIECKSNPPGLQGSFAHSFFSRLIWSCNKVTLTQCPTFQQLLRVLCHWSHAGRPWQTNIFTQKCLLVST